MGERGTTAASIVVAVILIILALIGIFFGLMLSGFPGGGIIGLPMLFIGLIMLAAGGLLIYNAQRRAPTPREAPHYVQPVTEPSGTAAIPSAPSPTRVVAQPVSTTRVALAYLEAPNGRLIVSSIDQPFYRSDFAGIVPAGLLDTISQSRPQFIIRFRGGRFYIEDSSSTNGTLLNGRQIRGMGMQELKDGDVISPAGVINLVFRTVSG
ncbi:MAG: FHA domain-containing protein [Candidatus Bathyarchaeia archaeon]